MVVRRGSEGGRTQQAVASRRSRRKASSMSSFFPSRMARSESLTLVGLTNSSFSLVVLAHALSPSSSPSSPSSTIFLRLSVPSSSSFNPSRISSAVLRPKMTSMALRFAPTSE